MICLTVESFLTIKRYENGHVTITNQSWSQDFKAGAVKKVCFQYSGNLDGFITCMQNDSPIIASVNNLNHWGNGGQIEIILENTGETLTDGWNSELTINLNGKLAATWGDGFVSSYDEARFWATTVAMSGGLVLHNEGLDCVSSERRQLFIKLP
jgi:hypothetical protein